MFALSGFTCTAASSNRTIRVASRNPEFQFRIVPPLPLYSFVEQEDDGGKTPCTFKSGPNRSLKYFERRRCEFLRSARVRFSPPVSRPPTVDFTSDSLSSDA